MSNIGKFVWYELMTSDMKAAESFYRDAIGWGAQDSGLPGQAYTILSAGPAMVAGLMAIPADAKSMGAKPGWIGYISCDDVDKTAKAVQAAGGKIYREPADIPTIGRFAVVADPDGAAFCLFKPNGEPPTDRPAPGTPGTFGWHELHAGDAVSAFAFYSKLFGWTKDTALDMGDMGVYQLFRTGAEEAVGGMMKKNPQVPQPFWLFYTNVDAIDAAAARIKKAGGQIVNGPHEVPGGSWILNCVDPQGAMFAVVAPKR